eukprot:6611058-Prymnesium_polylepis.1
MVDGIGYGIGGLYFGDTIQSTCKAAECRLGFGFGCAKAWRRSADAAGGHGRGAAGHYLSAAGPNVPHQHEAGERRHGGSCGRVGSSSTSSS